MNVNKIVVALGLTFAFVAGAANAATTGSGAGGGTVHFKGSIINAACSIDPESVDQTVNLGEVSNIVLKDAGKSDPVPFAIQLHNCDTTAAQTATVSFSGMADANNQQALGLNGSASGAGIIISDQSSQPIKLGDDSAPIKLIDGDNQLNFAAYLQGDGASTPVVPGGFDSVATFAMKYQ
jgi:type 1 fimbria pilin